MIRHGYVFVGLEIFYRRRIVMLNKYSRTISAIYSGEHIAVDYKSFLLNASSHELLKKICKDTGNSSINQKQDEMFYRNKMKSMRVGSLLSP